MRIQKVYSKPGSLKIVLIRHARLFFPSWRHKSEAIRNFSSLRFIWTISEWEDLLRKNATSFFSYPTVAQIIGIPVSFRMRTA